MALLQSLKQQYRLPAVKTIGIYTFTNFLIKGVSFMLLPLFTNPRYLSTADNGLLTLFSQSIFFLMPFVSLGLLQSASVDYFKLGKQQFKDFCTTGLAMSLSVSLIFIFAFWCCQDFLKSYFNLPGSFIWIIPTLTFLIFCYELVVMIIRNRGNAAQYMRITVVKVAIDLGLAFVLIILFTIAWRGRVISIMVSSAALAVFTFYFLKKHGFLFGRIRLSIIKSELKYSIPVIALQFSNFCLFSSDSFFLAASTDHAEVGVYGIACLFASIVFTLSTALTQYVVPKVNFELAKAVVNYKSIRAHFNRYFLLMTGGTLVLCLLIPLAYKYFIDEAYMQGLKYVYLLCAGYYFWCINYFFYTFLFFHKQKMKLFFLSITSITISLVSNYFFIKNMNSAGAALSVCLCYLLVLVITLLFTRIHWKQLL